MKNRVKIWFVWSQFKWLWLVAGNRYLQCDGLGKVFVLNKVGNWLSGPGVAGTVQNVLKEDGTKKGWGKKFQKEGFWIKGWVPYKRGGCEPLRNYEQNRIVVNI